MQIPDALPTLSRGSHSARSGKACVMEYVSVLAGQRFSDHPKCTHPLIATIARGINDNIVDDDLRGALLVPLIPRLARANGKEVTGIRLVEGVRRRRGMHHLHPAFVTYQALYGGHEGSATSMLLGDVMRLPTNEQVAFLTALLDEVDLILCQSRIEVTPKQMQRAVRTVTDSTFLGRVLTGK